MNHIRPFFNYNTKGGKYILYYTYNEKEYVENMYVICKNMDGVLKIINLSITDASFNYPMAFETSVEAYSFIDTEYENKYVDLHIRRIGDIHDMNTKINEIFVVKENKGVNGEILFNKISSFTEVITVHNITKNKTIKINYTDTWSFIQWLERHNVGKTSYYTYPTNYKYFSEDYLVTVEKIINNDYNDQVIFTIVCKETNEKIFTIYYLFSSMTILIDIDKNEIFSDFIEAIQSDINYGSFHQIK